MKLFPEDLVCTLLLLGNAAGLSCGSLGAEKSTCPGAFRFLTLNCEVGCSFRDGQFQSYLALVAAY